MELEGIESESLSVMSDSLQPHGLYGLWNSPVQNTGVGSLSLPQRTFPTQGSNLDLLQCRRTVYQLNHKGSPEGIMLSEINQRERQRLHDFTYMWNLKNKNKTKLIDTEWWFQRWRGWGSGWNGLRELRGRSYLINHLSDKTLMGLQSKARWL